MVYNYSMDDKVFQVQNYITVSEAAKILDVSVYRIHQFIKDPCPDCGRTEYTTVGNETIVEQIFTEGGCEYCNGTGMRLPKHGKFENEGCGWKLLEEEVLKLVDRKPGYPKGRKRRKKVRR